MHKRIARTLLACFPMALLCGCASTVPTKEVVKEFDLKSAYVYPVNGGALKPMNEVARIQCNGNGFMLLRIEGRRPQPGTLESMKMFPHYLLRMMLKGFVTHIRMALRENNPDYVEVLPGTYDLVLQPGNEDGFQLEYSKKLYSLRLDVKSRAWYEIRCREQPGGVTKVTTCAGLIVKTRTFDATIDVLEWRDRVDTVVAKDLDFVPMN